MELKAFRRRRVQEAMKDSNVQILIASLPQNIAYLTGGYVSVGQNVLCSSQAYVAYLLPEGKLAGILGHSQPSTTLDIYTHAFDKNKKAASAGLQGMLEI